jgi:cytoplasmic tRNA 2-thiolation protein 1
VAIGASGGKDSTVLAYVLKTLNERYDYGVEFVLLSIDEGIHGYRDDSLETVKRNKLQYDMPLQVVSYSELYGWTMDQIVAQIGQRNNCTYCGVFRRQALDRGAAKLGINHIVTGHNADDMAETVLMNLFRGDVARLDRCTAITTASEETDSIKRSKPLKFAYEKEIVLYAHYKKLDYFSTECTYSPEAFRGTARALIKNLEAVRPSSIIDIIRSGEQFTLRRKLRSRQQNPANVVRKRIPPTLGRCERCGYMSSNKLCKACVLLEGLNASRPRVEVDGSADPRGAALVTKQLEALEF